MSYSVVIYGHPALRSKAKPVRNFDDGLVALAEGMIATMNEHDGVGLAANQVGLPVQVLVADVTPMKKQHSVLRIGGEKVDVLSHMPMVLVNPEIEIFGETTCFSEGCLSLPEMRMDVIRPHSVRVTAQRTDGTAIALEADGFLARVLQHEVDHLNGVLIIDRASKEARRELEPVLRKMAMELAS